MSSHFSSFFSPSNQKRSRCIPLDKIIYFISCFLSSVVYTHFVFSHKRKRRRENLLVHILDQTKRTSMDRVSFLYIWTNRQIYALRPCIYLATSRREKKIDEQEIETEGEREGRRRRREEEEEERRKSKNQSTAINLLLCRQRHSAFYFFIRMV